MPCYDYYCEAEGCGFSVMGGIDTVIDAACPDCGAKLRVDDMAAENDDCKGCPMDKALLKDRDERARKEMEKDATIMVDFKSSMTYKAALRAAAKWWEETKRKRTTDGQD